MNVLATLLVLILLLPSIAWALGSSGAPGATAFSGLSGTVTDAQVPNTITVDLAGTATALASDPSDCSAGQLATGINASGTLTCTGAPTPTSIAVGSGTVLTKMVVYAPSLTPAASAAAIGSYEEEFTVSGIATTDKLFVNGPVPTALCPLVAIRPTDTDKVKMTFATLSALACTPAAGTYTILAIRS